jgi:hypothetical protein
VRTLRAILIVVALLSATLFAAIPVTDSFTAADGTDLVSHNVCWIQAVGSFEVNGNQVSFDDTAITNLPLTYWDEACDNFTDDQSSELTLVQMSDANNLMGVAVHAQATGGNADWYGAYCQDGSDCTVYEVIDNTFGAALCTRSGAIAEGSVFKMTITGTSTVTIKLYDDGVQIGADCTDASPLAGGQPGIAMYNVDLGESDPRGDAWTGDNVSVGGSSTTRSLGLLGVGQ